MAIDRSLHVGAWATWLGAVLAVLSATRNPIYIGLALLWITLTWLVVMRDPAVAALPDTPLSPLRFGVVVVFLSTLFNALTVHAGRTVLVTIPGSVPLISGIVTLEAALYGLLNGLVIAGLFAAFMVMTRAVAVRDLIRFIPRAFYPLAVVISIALTFVPTTLRQFHQIREAQAVRGHRMRGLRSWLPLFLPLLTGGMERALQLAEAMMARGFAGADVPEQETMLRVSMLTGLILVAGGLLLRMAWQQDVAGVALLLLGMGVIAVALRRAGQRHPHTVYRRRLLQPRDWIVIVSASATVVLFLVPLPGIGRASLYYLPYPEVTWPGLSLVLGAATWGLLGPAAVLGVQQFLSLRAELSPSAGEDRARHRAVPTADPAVEHAIRPQT